MEVQDLVVVDQVILEMEKAYLAVEVTFSDRVHLEINKVEIHIQQLSNQYQYKVLLLRLSINNNVVE